MPRIKIKTTTVNGRSPAAGSLEPGELAANLTNNTLYVGDANGDAVQIIDSMGQQDEDNVTITGGSINGANITANSINANNLIIRGGEQLYYNEGTRADLYTANWNNSTTQNMSDFGGLGNVTAHGWSSGPASYTLTLDGLPSHTQIRYEVYFHMVDSWDNETNYCYYTNNSGTEVEWARFQKQYRRPPFSITMGSGATYKWFGERYYSYAPWGGSSTTYEGSDTDAAGANGYMVLNTGWVNHTANSISFRHYIGADQAQSDEAGYLSHVRMWIRGGDSQTITSISTSANITPEPGVLHTQGAVKEYLDNEMSKGLVKNVFTYTGNSTYTKTGDDVRAIKVICIGGGGGARGYGESGGAGGYAERVFDASGISSVSVTIGGGGGGGNYFGYSGRGGTTSFGGYLSADGGYGANNHGAHIGGHGGYGYGGNINSRGGGGKGHNMGYNNQSNSACGYGGSSFFGGGRNAHHSASRPSDVAAPGSGGAGSVGSSGGAGSNGKSGCVIVYELY
jgi:hypothetical protein